MYCSACNKKTNRQGQRYCLDCHATHMREWRKNHRLTGLARLKMNCRAYFNVYLRRGSIKRQPCVKCGKKAQAHHPDYSKPLQVVWLCRPHHLELHRQK